MSAVRRGTLADLPAIIELGRSFYAEGNLPGRVEPEQVKRSWNLFLATGQGALFVLERDGAVVGALGALIYPDMNDGDLVATEAFWYVMPEHRGGGIALFNAFEAWASAAGAKRLMMVHLLDLMPKALEKFYIKKGYRPIEIHYIKA